MTSTPTLSRPTLADLRAMRAARQPISILTCYDYSSARVLQGTGVHMLLVGDSAANTILGLASTRELPPDFLLTLTGAVRRGAPNVFLLADLPFGSAPPQVNIPVAVAQARRFIGETGADAIKVEVTADDLLLVESLARAGVPVCAHLGLLPQRVTSPEGYKAQGRTPPEAEVIVAAAVKMFRAGAELLLIEAVPDEVTARISAQVKIPVLGCGAGPSADGHVVVLHDLLGFNAKPPRFVEVVADFPAALEAAARHYVALIATRQYPAARHQYHMRGGATPG